MPQSVMTSDGQVLDVDIVLNEMFKDGDELHVEYSAGPKPYAARRGNAPLWSGSAASEASAAALWLADAWDICWVFSPVLPCRGACCQARQLKTAIYLELGLAFMRGGSSPPHEGRSALMYSKRPAGLAMQLSHLHAPAISAPSHLQLTLCAAAVAGGRDARPRRPSSGETAGRSCPLTTSGCAT